MGFRPEGACGYQPVVEPPEPRPTDALALKGRQSKLSPLPCREIGRFFGQVRYRSHRNRVRTISRPWKGDRSISARPPCLGWRLISDRFRWFYQRLISAGASCAKICADRS